MPETAVGPVVILYENWRGETAVRRIEVASPMLALRFGATDWHPEPQWLLAAHDVDKDAARDFALSGIKAWGKEAVDAALRSASETQAPLSLNEGRPALHNAAVESLRTMLAGALAFIAADVAMTDPDQTPGVVSTLDLATEKLVTFDAWAARRALEDTAAETFQSRVRHRLDEVTAGDPTDLDERRDRFGEEALELIQALGGTREGVLALVDYVWGRPAGEPAQEMGGALTTLAALASHAGHDMAACGEAELARTWTPEVFARIRRKRAARGGRGALPGVDGDVVTGGGDARR